MKYRFFLHALFVLLLTPVMLYAQKNITIGNGPSSGGSWSGGDPDVWTASAYSATVNKDEIVSRLNTGISVTVTTPQGSITDSVGISIWKTSGGDATLRLIASYAYYNTSFISFNDKDTIASTSGALTIVMNADADGNHDGYIATATTSGVSGSYFASNGGNIIMGGGSDPSMTPAYGNSGTGGGAPGIVLAGVKVDAGSGSVSIRGAGCNSGLGVSFCYGTSVTTTVGSITVQGNGGTEGGGVYMSEDSTKFQSTDGSITIIGTAGSSASSMSGNGFYMLNASRILTTTGTISITGVTSDSYATATAVVITGRNYSTNVNNPLIQTVDGSISIHATTGSMTSSISNMAYGVELDHGARLLATGTGSISLTSSVGAAPSKYQMYGLYMTNNKTDPTCIQTNSGNIAIHAAAGAGGLVNSGNDGIYIYSNSSSCPSFIASTSGNISIHGTSNNGGNGIFLWNAGSYIQSSGNIDILGDTLGSGKTSGYGVGVFVYSGSYIKTTGSGNLSITGTGQLQGSNDYGVSCAGTISTESGNLTINGFGGGNADNSNYGVDIANSITSTSGRIVINGTAGYSGAGVTIEAGSITTQTGSLYITGKGKGLYGFGVNGGTSSTVIASISGDTCLISGTGDGTYAGFNGGYQATIGSSSFRGELILEADGSTSDQIGLSYLTGVYGKGDLTIRPKQASTTIGIGGTSGNGGVFDLSTWDINTIKDGFRSITIGRQDGTGAITVNGVGFTDTVLIRSMSGPVAINGQLSVGSNELAITTGGPVTQSASIYAGMLALSGTGSMDLSTQNNHAVAFSASVPTVKFRNDSSFTLLGLNAVNAYISTNSPLTKTIDCSISDLELDGSAVYTMSDTVRALKLSGSASLTLNGPFAADTLIMNGGNIDATTNTLCLGSNALAQPYVSRTSGAVLGTIKRWFTADTISNALLPIGTSSYYRPATLSFTTAPASGGSVTAQFVASDPGTSGLPVTDSDDGVISPSSMETNGYWSLTAGNGLTGGTYKLDVDADGFTGVTDYQKLKIVKRVNSSSPWTLNGTHVAGTGSNASPVAHRAGMTGFSEFAIGQAVIPEPAFYTDYTYLWFGTQNVGTQVKDSLTIVNTGTKVMHITSVVHDSSAFIVTPGAATVGIGDTVTYYVTFAPKAAGSLIDTLKFYHDASGSPYALPLYGEGHVPAPIFSTWKTGIDFGAKGIGTTTMDSITITNGGDKAMNITSVVHDSSSFMVTQGDTTISAGDSVTYHVAFTPLTEGTKTDTLKFYHDAFGSPYVLPLNGEGYAAMTGSGTEDSPYMVKSYTHLKQIKNDLSAVYRLACNIDASASAADDGGSGFLPIGNSSTSFNGTLHGGGHRIMNLHISRPATYSVGLFGYADGYSYIDSLGLTDVVVIGLGYTGGLAGISEGTMKQCFTTGSVTGGSYYGYAYTGGLAGISNEVDSCYSIARVIADGYYTGGLIGESNGLTVGSYAIGSVSSSGYYIGGLIGGAYGSVDQSYAIDTVYTSGDCAGGLVGYANAAISRSYASGPVVCVDWYAGGLVGVAECSITNCYATGSVSASGAVGGLAGNTDNSTFAYCYSTSAVSSGNAGYVGGLVGEFYNINIHNCFWNNDISGSTGMGYDDNFGGSSLTDNADLSTAQMENWMNYTGWDFYGESTDGTDDIWVIADSINSGYPHFRYLDPTASPVTSVGAAKTAVPKVFALNQNYPNPFNPTTTISFTLAQNGFTTLKIYDLLGREVATLVNGDMKAGIVNTFTFNASKLSSGVYFSRLVSNGSVQVKKLILMK